MKPIRIGNRSIGSEHPVFIIAEAGSNHNGSLEQAYGLIDAAAEAGADAVKFQTFKADRIYPKTQANVEYLKKLGVTKPIYEIIKEMEMPYEWVPKLAEYCRKKGIMFMSTPFDEGAVDVLDPYVDAFKIASYELTHLPLIRYIARKGKPIIFSTGAVTNMVEVRAVIRAIQDEGNDSIIAMQCTAKYPAPPESMNLKTIETMRQELGVYTGLSDHSLDPLHAPVAAVALGAVVIEKHFTTNRNLPGPDHSFALEPQELKAMVQGIKAAKAMLGTGEKHLDPVEQELVNYRRAIYTIKPIKAGEQFNEENIAVLRKPGITEQGMHPEMFSSILQKRASRDLPEYALLKEVDLK